MYFYSKFTWSRWQSAGWIHAEAFLFSLYSYSRKNKWLSNHWSGPRLQTIPSYTIKSWLAAGKKSKQTPFTAGAILLFKDEHKPVWPDASATEGQVSKCCIWGGRGSSTRSWSSATSIVRGQAIWGRSEQGYIVPTTLTGSKTCSQAPELASDYPVRNKTTNTSIVS